MSAGSSRYLTPRRTAPATSAAYAIGDAGSGTGAWKPVLDALRGSPLELRPMRLPGRENRLTEPLLTTLAEQADDVLEGLLPAVAADPRPYLLVGACSGATIAFEVARRLQAGSHPAPAALVAISQQAPHTPAAGVVAKDGMTSAQLRDWFASGADAPTGMDIGELFAFVEPVLRADIRAYETHRHRPGPPLGVPVLTIVGSRDPQLAASDVAPWSELTSKDVHGITLDGDHQLTRSAPRELAEALTAAALRRSLPSPGERNDD